MTSPNTFLIANTTLIEEELREHRRMLHEEAERHRLFRLCRIGKPGRAWLMRQRIGHLLITAGERLRGDGQNAVTVLHRPPTLVS